MQWRQALAERMARPQRHRLLQGFPAVPAMRKAGPTRLDGLEGADLRGFTRGTDGSLTDRAYDVARQSLERYERDPALRASMGASVPAHEQPSGVAALARGDRSEPPYLALDGSRALIVGVIPHTQCVPRREACGFCTFPHDRPDATVRREMVADAQSDIVRLCENESLKGREVDAIYFGGGTANLSSPEEVASIVATLANGFSIAGAELTLEGAPHLFDRLLSSHLKSLARAPVAQRRISIGVQTFEPGYLRMMGRESFGDEMLVRRLVRRCASLEITTSCDLLFNLPGQSRELMLRDVDTAVSMGLDQVCLYNLVLHGELGTPWAREPEFVAAMPDNDEACANWLALRARLLEHGYVQSTLTNFERADVAAGPRRFRYEPASFSVERTDGLGIGPLSISTFVNFDERRGIKLLRRKGGQHTGPWSGEDLMFRYDEGGLRALFLTRGLAKTRIDGAVYEALFRSKLADDLREPLEALRAESLVSASEADVELTPRGMFYADSVVALLAMRAAAGRDGQGMHTRDLLRERYRMTDHYGGMG
jgi:oxygen-independent coproporphyrinogen-3 oxidase